MLNADEIIEACRKARAVPANAANCNEFVITVAGRCGVTLSRNADAIMHEIASSPWEQLGHDGVKAGAAAANGALVVGGMTSHALDDAHGHVVIVVKGPLAHGKYPTAYWGSQNPRIRADGGLGTTINWSFSAKHRDRVVYACLRPTPAAPS